MKIGRLPRAASAASATPADAASAAAAGGFYSSVCPAGARQAAYAARESVQIGGLIIGAAAFRVGLNVFGKFLYPYAGHAQHKRIRHYMVKMFGVFCGHGFQLRLLRRLDKFFQSQKLAQKAVSLLASFREDMRK